MFVLSLGFGRALSSPTETNESFVGCVRYAALLGGTKASRVAARTLVPGPEQLTMRQRRDLREEKRLRNLEYARLHRKRVPRSAPGRRFPRSGNAAQSAAERESVYSLYFTLTHAKQGARSGRREKQQGQERDDES